MSQPFQWIADLFAQEFDRAEVRAEYRHLAGEAWLTRFIAEPTPAMADVAQALMAEHAELDLSLVITIKAL
ncbi:MAG: hypothetical protein IPN92_04240 [Chromatiaceae bacterium]|nr:hypothetical protein [Chromatiaceae bacterium]